MIERFLPSQVEGTTAMAVWYKPQPTVNALILRNIAVRVAGFHLL